VVTKYAIGDFEDWVNKAEISLWENLRYHNRKPTITKSVIEINTVTMSTRV
jgi:hypothetical protein